MAWCRQLCELLHLSSVLRIFGLLWDSFRNRWYQYQRDVTCVAGLVNLRVQALISIIYIQTVILYKAYIFRVGNRIGQTEMTCGGIRFAFQQTREAVYLCCAVCALIHNGVFHRTCCLALHQPAGRLFIWLEQAVFILQRNIELLSIYFSRFLSFFLSFFLSVYMSFLSLFFLVALLEMYSRCFDTNASLVLDCCQLSFDSLLRH